MGRRHLFVVMQWDKGGFLILVGGKEYKVTDVDEVAAALKHWSGTGEGAFNAQCPLCRAMKKDQQKDKLADLIRKDKERRRIGVKN